ncbi:MAG: hypothetical protein NVS9B15_07370 [Acidobacteriaceae bacterium]
MLDFVSHHYTGLIIIAVLFVVALLLHRTPAGDRIKQSIPDRPQRRILLANVGFVISFAVVRGMAWSIRHNIGPFHNVEHGGVHIHHMFWGIIILLLVGFGWLAELGNGDSAHSAFMGRFMSLLYGAGAGMTLDEFALWLNLRDVYWQREGRESIMAALTFFSLCTITYIFLRARKARS